MLELKEVYFGHRHSKSEILKGIEFSLREGEMTTILGPNGSGKTTLFKCICGLWEPQKGSILFNNKDILKLTFEQRARICAVVPQEHEPPFPYSVLDAVLMGRVSRVSLFSSPSKSDYLKAEEAIDIVGINHLKDRPYTKISGGERQLVLIARALAQEAPLLVLDEPTSHLDFRNQVLILNKVKEIARQKGLTVLMTLHDPNLAILFSERIIMLKEGVIFANGLPQDVITADNLKNVYKINVSIINWNGTKIVYPEVSQVFGSEVAISH